MVRSVVVLLSGALLVSCANDQGIDPETVSGHTSELTLSQRRAVSERIGEVIAGQGITNKLLFAGLASAETTMAHCWSDAKWACQGPDSADCAGGPVIAGAGDGPCSLRQGGLGLFQFDAGDFDDTLEREGTRILSFDGNVEAAIDFVLNMVVQSVYIDGVANESQAIDWINAVRPDTDASDNWLKTVTHYYNGCIPGRCSVYTSRLGNYTDHFNVRYQEFDHEFWYPPVPEPDPAPCDDCERFDGTFSGTGAQALQPDGSYYFTSRSGTQEAWLIGPDGTDFDLSLYRWTGRNWSRVRTSFSATSEENIQYNGSSGYYVYLLKSYRGAGDYRFYLKRP